jgi:xanthine dehydrogenase accessory factor
MATGVATVLVRAGLARLLLTELPNPKAVRRTVAFSEAIHDGSATVEGITARRVRDAVEAEELWRRGELALVVDEGLRCLTTTGASALIDATLRKRPGELRIGLAPLVIALGPGFEAGVHCHAVVETQRGPRLGSVIQSGFAEPDSGEPTPILGQSTARVLRAPAAGTFHTDLRIGTRLAAGAIAGEVRTPSGENLVVRGAIPGLLRGLLRSGTPVDAGEKLGDVDPRPDPPPLDRISDKADAIGQGVLEAIRRLAPTLLPQTEIER